MKTIILIDGSNLAYRLWHQPQLQKLIRKDGKKSGVFYGFLINLQKLLIKFQPHDYIVVFDSITSSAERKLKNPNYKSNRPKSKGKKALFRQIRDVQTCLIAIGAKVAMPVDVEADDLLFHLANEIRIDNEIQGNQIQAIIVSADHDLFQSIGSSVRVYDDQRNKMWSDLEVKERYGILPNQITLYKSLVGDKSDNIKGVIGIGPKAALTLIKRYKTYAKARNNLTKKQRKMFDLAYNVVSVRLNAKIALDVIKLLRMYTEVDYKLAKQLLKEYSCTSILVKFKSWVKQFKGRGNNETEKS